MPPTTKGEIGAKVTTTIIAITVLILKKIWPDLLDTTDLFILGLALLPWLSSILKSVEFPGGGKIELRDVQNAVSKATEEASDAAIGRAGIYADEMPPDIDPDLALVGLRIEIERRVRRLANKAGVESQKSLARTIRTLQKEGVLASASVSGLQELVVFGNQAAHGKAVDREAAEWARDYGPQVLAALDEVLDEV